MKIILGTVQFGCQYGVNSVGRPDKVMVRDILETAAVNHINMLDTSAAYGNAEEILGNTLQHMNFSFQLISKYPRSKETVAYTLEKTLQTLGTTHIYGYLLHHFSVFQQNPEIWKDFLRLKEKKKVEKIGFSLYFPSELEMLLEQNISFDLLQIPYNLFDRQFEPYFPLLKKRGVEIHVRSTFLQGLFFKDRNSLPTNLKPLRVYLEQLDDYAQKMEMTVAEVALNYNLQNQYIDGVLIGVDSVSQLQDNIRSISDKKIDLFINVNEKKLLNPSNWI